MKQQLNFIKNIDGLLPAIVQDANDKRVLMLGYMNQEAYEKTQKEKIVTFYSRTKQRLWTKGETSSNYLALKSIDIDCDGDTLLISAIPAGPICHTGALTCFNDNESSQNFLETLEQLILSRKTDPNADSYTSSLFRAGINKIAQKVGEEAVELVIEAKDDNKERFLNEAADLVFHFMILLTAKDCTLADVESTLRERHNK